MDVVSYLYGPMPTQPLGWFKKPVARVEDLKGLKFRTVGLAVDIFTEHGRGGEPAARRRDRAGARPRPDRRGRVQQRQSSDRVLGFPDVAKNCMLQSFHQSAEQFEILFNKGKYDALAPELKSDHRLRGAGGQRRHELEGDRPQHKDYVELKKAGVNFYKTPDAILRSQLDAWDKVIAKKAAENPMFKKVLDSQKAYRPDAPAQWQNDYMVDFKMAYNHYFGKQVKALSHDRRGAARRPAFACGDRRCNAFCSRWIASRPGSVRRSPGRSSLLTLGITWEVFSRYVLDKPHDWTLDVQIMLYGMLFMMAGAYTLAKNGHVRGDVLYGFFRPRTQATHRPGAVHRVLPARHRRAHLGRLDLLDESLAIREQTFNADAAAAVPVQVLHSRCRRAAAAAGHRRDRALRRLHPRRGNGRRASRTSRRSTSTSSRQMVHVKDEDIAALDKFVVPPAQRQEGA